MREDDKRGQLTGINSVITRQTESKRRQGQTVEDLLLLNRSRRIVQRRLPSPRYVNNFIIMGAPGSGKGTVTKVLRERFGLTSIATGDALRAHQAANTQIGKEVGALLAAGALVPDRIVNEIVRQEIVHITQTAAGFILDGYPRNSEQASYLHRKVGDLITAVILLDIPSEEICKRVLNRRICNNCNLTFNYYYNLKPGVDQCPICSRGLTRREDDDQSTILKRVELFNKTTLPVVEFYRQQGLLISMDASHTPEQIADIIQERFYSRLESLRVEDLIYWDEAERERFLWAMVRLSHPDFNYGVNKRAHKSDYNRMQRYFPWPLDGEHVVLSGTSEEEELLVNGISNSTSPLQEESRPLSNHERRMREIILQQLLRERESERESPIFAGVDPEELERDTKRLQEEGLLPDNKEDDDTSGDD